MGKGNARRAKKDGKMAFYKRMRKAHPGARDEDIKKQWEDKVARQKDNEAKSAAQDKAAAEAKELKRLEKAERAKLSEEVKAKALKAKEDREKANVAILEAKAKETQETPAVTA